MEMHSLQGQLQFTFFTIYNKICSPERRFQIEQILMFISYMLLLALFNFHVFHISNFSTTSCMSNQMLESFILT
jgi:hypothetical protein